MYKYIISDTSCLILFDNIGELDILRKTYGEITTTPEVIQEYGRPIPDWIKQETVKNKDKQVEFEKLVDKGEASAIALALELENSVLIIDDKRGIKLAREQNIELTGTLGTILKAKNMGIISRIRPLVEKLKAANYRISTDIIEGILKRAGE